LAAPTATPGTARDEIRATAQWIELPADRLEEFGRTVGTARGSVLIARLARAERGLNIVDDAGRSLIGSVWLVVSPIPILDEPPELLAHVHGRAHAEATPTEDPAGVLDLMLITAAKPSTSCSPACPTGLIDPWIMTTALRKFEQLSTDDTDADTLAPLLRGLTPQTRPVREFISTDPSTGVVRTPGWIFDAARWNLAARIAAAPMTIDGTLPDGFGQSACKPGSHRPGDDR
jgi:hypothetical protein